MIEEAKIEKIDTTDDPAVESADWDEYEPGRRNSKSPPVEYSVEGKVVSNIEEGAYLTVHRWSRNGEPAEGVMRTSEIQSVTEEEDFIIVETQSSVYKVTPHED